MSEIKDYIPNYERACTTWPDAPNLRQCVDAVHRAAEGMQHGLIEIVKSCIECVCTTILNDRGETVPTLPTGVELLRHALDSLGLQNTRGLSKIDSVVSAFNKLAEGIVALRNERGVVGHGKDGFLDALERDHLRSFVFIGDAICGLLLNAYEGIEPNLTFTREPFERFQTKSALIDRSVVMKASVETIDDDTELLIVELAVGPGQVPTVLRIEPSRLLFHVERSAYVDLLSQSQELDEQEPEGADAADIEAAVVLATPEIMTSPTIAPTEKKYLGTLDPIRDEISALCVVLQLEQAAHNRLVENLLVHAESGMAPDWRVRDSLQAAIRVDFAAAMRQEGIPAQRAKQEAARVLNWLSDSDAVRDLQAKNRKSSD